MDYSTDSRFTQIPAKISHQAAVKSFPHRPEDRRQLIETIEQQIDIESDDRVLLEAAGAGILLGSAKAQECLTSFIWDRGSADLRMESVLILTEQKTPTARELLKSVATSERFADDEICQAAVWGLGKAGLSQYSDLGDLPMLKPLRQSGEELGDLRPLQCFFHRHAKIDTKSP